MLTNCPECSRQISTEAAACPHCGYPVSVKKALRRKMPTRMRLPNGFGQITELKNRNLRNPFRAMITQGTGKNGRPICRLLRPNAYFATYNEAYSALVEYHKNPIAIEPGMTVLEIYRKWSSIHYTHLKSEKTIKVFESAWKYCEPIYNMPIGDVKAYHLRNILESDRTPYAGKKSIKSILNQLFDYAVEYELADKNVARALHIEYEKHETAQHIDFTEEEMQKLWNNAEDPTVRMILVQCYSGWRPGELCELKISNIDLEEGSFMGGKKTSAGTNRRIPIHSRILDIVKQEYEYSKNKSIPTLFSQEDIPMEYAQYRQNFANIVASLDLNPVHKPHDPRVHFVTQAKKYQVDDYAIKKIVGHAVSDLTEAVYTRRKFSWLKDEIEKIK